MEETMRTLHFRYCFAQLESLYIAHFTDHRFRIVTEGVLDVILLQVGLKCFSMRMTFDFLHELLNADVFCFFHNCMWQSWHSEVNVSFLELGWLLSTHGSPRSCLICVYVFVFVFVFVYKFNRHWHTTLDGFWSIHGSPRAFATKQDTFLDLLGGLWSTYGSPRSW